MSAKISTVQYEVYGLRKIHWFHST